jgi:hypothetical protein
MGHEFEGFELDDVDDVDPMHLLCRHGLDLADRIVAQVDELEPIDVGALAPVVPTRQKHGPLAHLVLHQLEGTHAVGAGLETAALLRIEDQEGVMEQMLGHRQLGHLAVQAHRVIVHLLDRIGVPQPGLGGLALLVILEHVTLHQAEDRGSGRLVEHPVDVPDHVVRRKRAAVVPPDPLAQV